MTKEESTQKVISSKIEHYLVAGYYVGLKNVEKIITQLEKNVEN